MSSALKLALPAGKLREPVARMLDGIGLKVPGYGEASRTYRLEIEGRSASVRIFRPRDIPIQIALGNYDLAMCELSWIDEFLTRFPQEGIVKVRSFDIAASGLYVASAPSIAREMDGFPRIRGLRVASEYPNLAEAFAMAARLPGYRIIPVWGAADSYPPEDADLTLIAAQNDGDVLSRGLVPLHFLLQNDVWLIANGKSLREKDMSYLLTRLIERDSSSQPLSPRLNLPMLAGRRESIKGPVSGPRDSVRLALPDGHLQRAAVVALRQSGLFFQGYDLGAPQRRPKASLPGLDVKVVRPQDMPQLVASGSFDLAISGRDCLRDHLYRFPSSPVEEVADLALGQFNLSAVVSEELPAENIDEALQYWRAEGRSPIRVASEFVNIADHYARACRMSRYRVIPIAGASEGFLPEDADLLVEGTETGRTLVENGLKAIDVIFRSTLCLIACRSRRPEGSRGEIFDQVISAFG